MKESTDTQIGKSVYVCPLTTKCYGICLKEWNERNSEEFRINGHLGILGKQVENNKLSALVSPCEIWESSHLSLRVLCKK